MRLHKFIIDGKKIFILEEGTKRPSGNISLNDITTWKGYAQGENSNVIVRGLENPKVFSKEEEKKEEEPKEKLACVSKVIRDFATTIKE